MTPKEAETLYDRLHALTRVFWQRNLEDTRYFSARRSGATCVFECYFAHYIKDPVRRTRAVSADPWNALPANAKWCVAVPDKELITRSPEIVLTNMIPIAIGDTPEEALEKAEFEVLMANLGTAGL